MQSFLAGDFEPSICWLSKWIDATPSAREMPYAKLALSAVSRIGKLLGDGPNSEAIEAAAEELCRRIEAFLGQE